MSGAGVPRGTPPDLPSLLDELQAIARTGLAFSRDPFERERFQRLLELSAAAYADTLGVPTEEILARWRREIGQITPKVGAEAAVFDDAGRILVMRRHDDDTWGLPGGWLEPNESPTEAVEREAREETGVTVQVERLVDVFTRRAVPGQTLQSTVSIVYLCRPLGGSFRTTHESLEIAYLPVDQVRPWHGAPGWHDQHAAAAYRLWASLRSGG